MAKPKYKVFDGDKYSRDFYDYEGASKNPFWDRLEQQYVDGKWVTLKKTNNLPDVICTCGNYTFELEYGDYEINATCTKCKNKNTVYSG